MAQPLIKQNRVVAIRAAHLGDQWASKRPGGAIHAVLTGEPPDRLMKTYQPSFLKTNSWHPDPKSPRV